MRVCEQEVKDIIKTCPIQGNHKYVIVDVKYQYLKPGYDTTPTGWHRDFRREDPTETSNEINHVWASTMGTLFREDDGTEWQAEPKKWYTYDRNKLHRGPISDREEFRLFIRVSETMQRYK